MKYLVIFGHLLSLLIVTAFATCAVMFFIDKDRNISSGVACLLIAFFLLWRLFPTFLKWNRNPSEPLTTRDGLFTVIRVAGGFCLSLAAIAVLTQKEGFLFGVCLLSAGLLPLSPLDEILFIRYRSILPAFSILPRYKIVIILSGLWWCVALYLYFASSYIYYEKHTVAAIVCCVIGVAMLLLNPVAALLNNWRSLSPEEQEALSVEAPVVEPKVYTEAQKESLQLIRKGESATVEFKSTLRVDVQTGKPEKFIQHSVIKTIAAFLNSQGGTLLIGIEDNKNILGLQKDLSSFAKADKLDEFQKYLDNLLSNSIGNRFHRYLRIEFPELEEKIICVITIQKKSGRPVYVTNDAGQEMFYIRRLASTIDLKPSEIVKYIQEHWS